MIPGWSWSSWRHSSARAVGLDSSTSEGSHALRQRSVRNRLYGGRHDRDHHDRTARRPALGATARGRRGRPPGRLPRPPPHDVPLEGRWPRRGRPAGAGRRLRADPRRAAEAPGLRRGLLLQHRAARGVARAAVGDRRLGRAPGLAVRQRGRTTRPTSCTRCGTAPSSAPTRGSPPPSRTAVSASPSARPSPNGRASLRRMLFDLVEEYGRHTGHADLIRESIDGLVGENPPRDWRP